MLFAVAAFAVFGSTPAFDKDRAVDGFSATVQVADAKLARDWRVVGSPQQV
jgi:hypothetical protein